MEVQKRKFPYSKKQVKDAIEEGISAGKSLSYVNKMLIEKEWLFMKGILFGIATNVLVVSIWELKNFSTWDIFQLGLFVFFGLVLIIILCKTALDIIKSKAEINKYKWMERVLRNMIDKDRYYPEDLKKEIAHTSKKPPHKIILFFYSTIARLRLLKDKYL